MAFVFEVETGTGSSTATSYVSVEDATDIIDTNIHAASSWGALSLDSQQKLLSWASRYLDQHAIWEGVKTVEASALRWPRTGVCDRDGILIGPNTIPQQLKEATAEMARYLIDTDRSVERDQDAIERIKADVVELEFVSGYRLPQIPDNMHYLIYGLGTLSSGPVRFARLIRT